MSANRTYRITMGTLALLVLVSGCGDSTGPAPGGPRILSIEGATEPILRRGDTVVLEGSGFNANQGESRVLFSGGAQGELPSAEVLLWSDLNVIVEVPDGAVSGPVTIELTNGEVVGPLQVLVRTSEDFEINELEWKSGTPLPNPSKGPGLSSLVYPSEGEITNLALVTGGFRESALSVSLIGGFSEPAGITSWDPADSTAPSPRFLHATAAATRANARLGIIDEVLLEGVSYLIGGIGSDGSVQSSVFGIGISRERAQGIWTPLKPLPKAAAGAAALVVQGNLFVIGGLGPDSVAGTEVFLARIDSTGLLTGWFEGPPLPEGRAFAGAAAIGRNLFLLGGETGKIDPGSAPDPIQTRSSVFHIEISGIGGFPVDAGWTELPTPLSRGRSRHATFALDRYLLVSGGSHPDAATGGDTEFARWTGSELTPFQDLPSQSVAQLAGGPIRESGFGVLRDRQGRPHPLIVGGTLSDGQASNLTWWH